MSNKNRKELRPREGVWYAPVHDYLFIVEYVFINAWGTRGAPDFYLRSDGNSKNSMLFVRYANSVFYDENVFIGEF